MEMKEMKLIYKIDKKLNDKLFNTGILIGRLGFGFFIAFGHGLGKLQKFSEFSDKFPDPLGIGSTPSMALAIFAEFVCGLLLAIGAFTRLALTQLLATMAVAAFLFHSKDPLFAAPGAASKEFALVYFWGFLMLMFTGPGKYSIDHLLVNKFCRKD